MNLTREMERLTEPAGKGGVKMLSKDEIRELQEKGKVTPIAEVHEAGWRFRVSMPTHLERSY